MNRKGDTKSCYTHGVLKSREPAFVSLLSYTRTIIEMWFSGLSRIRATFLIVAYTDYSISETLANIPQRVPRSQTTNVQYCDWTCQNFQYFSTHQTVPKDVNLID